MYKPLNLVLTGKRLLLLHLRPCINRRGVAASVVNCCPFNGPV